MKIRFSKLALLALFGGVFGMMSCTDYSQDIDDVNKRIDQLTDSQVATLQNQVEGLESYVTYLEGLDVEGNLNSLKTTVAALQSADQALQEQINKANGTISALQAELNNANSNIDALNAALAAANTDIQALNSGLAAANADIKNLVAKDAELAAKDAELAAKDAELAAKYGELAAADAELAAADAELAAANAALAAKLDALTSEVAANAAAIAAVSAKADLNASDIAALKNDVKGLNNSLTEYQAVVDGQIAKLDSRVAATEASINTINSDIKAINKQINNLNEAIQSNTEDLETYKTLTDATIKIMKKSIKSLEGQYEDLEASMASQFKEMKKKFNDYVLTSTFDAFKASNTAALEAIKSDYNAQINTLKEADTKLDDRIKALENAKTSIDNEIKALQQADENLENSINAVITSLTSVKGDVAANAQAIAQIKESLEEITTIKNNISTIQNEILAINVDIDKLMNRVQSIVYIPDYSDGKATIKQALLYGEVIEGVESVLKYKVAPEELASQLAAAYAQDADIFSYNLKSVEVRGAIADPALTITGISAEANGVIAVKVIPENFDPAFWTPSPIYSASLVLVNENESVDNNYKTEYTNLIASDPATADNITLTHDAMIGALPISVSENIEYTSDETFVFFADAEPKFAVNGTGEYTVAQLKSQFGYDVANYIVQGVESPVYTAPATAELTAYSTADGTLGYKTVSMGMNTAKSAADRKAAVGGEVKSWMHFDIIAGGATVAQTNYDATIIIKKIQLYAKANAVASWNWTENVATDKVIFGGSTADYTNAAVIDVIGENNLDKGGVTLADVLAGTLTSTTVNLDGAAATGVTVDNYAVDGSNLKFDITGHAYGKTYEVETVYELANADVTITSTINTVDRVRQEVSLDLGVDTISFVKDLDNTSTPATLAAILADPIMSYAEINGTAIEFADYLADASVQTIAQSSTGVKPAIFDAAAGTAAYNVTAADIASATLTADGNYEFSYVDKLTAAYGQIFNITKKVVVKLPNYTLIHSPYKVALDGTTYYSEVEPKWDFDYANLTQFNVYDVELMKAFLPQLDGVTKTWDDAAVTAAGLKVSYSFKTAPESTGITLDGTTNIIEYLGYDDQVYVTAKLVIVNSDASEVVLPTQFDGNGIYSTYEVRKFEPFKDLKGADKNIKVTTSQLYDYNVLNSVSLDDVRGYSVYKNAAFSAAGAPGFAVAADAAYGLSVSSMTADFGSITDPMILNEITFDDATGILSFNYDSSLVLQKPIVVPVTVTFDHTWAKTGTCQVTFNVTFSK